MGWQGWTGRELTLLREMRAQGYSAARMAFVIGRSRSAVLGQVFRLGLPLHHDKRYRKKNRPGGGAEAVEQPEGMG